MRVTHLKIYSRLLYLFSALSLLLIFSCKQEAAAPEEDKTYTVTVDAKGGTGVETSYTVKEGDSLTIPDPKAASTGQLFFGWTYSDGTDKVDFISGETIVTKDITIYAIWRPGYTVTIDANGGTIGKVTHKAVTIGGTLAPLSTSELPSKTDNEIAYFSMTHDDFSTQFEFDKTQVNGDITIYPHYRLSIDKIKRLLVGDWFMYQAGEHAGASTVNYPNSSYSIFREEKIDGIVADCSQYNSNVNLIDLTQAANADVLVALKSIPIIDITTETASSINQISATETEYTFNNYNNTGKSYSYTLNGYSDHLVYLNGTQPPVQPTCEYNSKSRFSLKAYEGPNSDVILMDQFQSRGSAKITSYTLTSTGEMSELYIQDDDAVSPYYKFSRSQ